MRIDDLKHRILDNEELQEIDFQYQGGIEFIFWFYDMGNLVSNEKLIKGINVVLSKLKEGLDYPVSDYNSDREVTTLMGFTLGQMLHKSFNWKWVYFNDPSVDFSGYSIVSPDESFGICIEDLFFREIFYKNDVHFAALGALLIDNKFPKHDLTSFEIYQPWKNDYQDLFLKLNPNNKSSGIQGGDEQKEKVKKSFWQRIIKRK